MYWTNARLIVSFPDVALHGVQWTGAFLRLNQNQSRCSELDVLEDEGLTVRLIH